MVKRVVLALGSSMGNKLKRLSEARDFLTGLSSSDIRCSSIWETEPVGIAQNQFYNTVVQIHYDGAQADLLKLIKQHELHAGRDQHSPRWADRPIDIDIIDFGGTFYLDADLEIPHPAYKNRLFVLYPLQDLEPSWMDSVTGDHIEDMIKIAPRMRLSKIKAKW